MCLISSCSNSLLDRPMSRSDAGSGIAELETPIPILAEPLAWLIGKWEADVGSGDRFPVDMPGPYHETLIVKQEKITMFDRPSLNIRYCLSRAAPFGPSLRLQLSGPRQVPSDFPSSSPLVHREGFLSTFGPP